MPLGSIAIPDGSAPTVIGVPAAPLAGLNAVTVLPRRRMVTKARPPRGPIAIREGARVVDRVPTTARVSALTMRDVAAPLGDEGVQAVGRDRDAVGFVADRANRRPRPAFVAGSIDGDGVVAGVGHLDGPPFGVIATPRGGRRP